MIAETGQHLSGPGQVDTWSALDGTFAEDDMVEVMVVAAAIIQGLCLAPPGTPGASMTNSGLS